MYPFHFTFRQAFQSVREFWWNHVFIPPFTKSQAWIRWLSKEIWIRHEHLWKDGRRRNGSIQQFFLFVWKDEYGPRFLTCLLHAWEQMLSTRCRYKENLGVLLSGWHFKNPTDTVYSRLRVYLESSQIHMSFKNCFFLQLNSLEMTCESNAIMAGTLANGGTCPITGERVFRSEAVGNVCSLMSSCGMSIYSGQFAFNVGI